ncbi:MAG: glycoside hydrolase family 31 protein [Rikenellaceae bacterium]
MRKTTLITLLLAASTSLFAQQSEIIKSSRNEKWWGISSSYGIELPFQKAMEIDFENQIFIDPSASILVSSSGRYLFSDSNLNVTIGDDATIEVTAKNGDFVVEKGGKTLREAVLYMSQRNLKNNKESVDSEVLALPFINFRGSGGENELLQTVENLKSQGIEKSLFILSNSWQKYSGALEFDYQEYPNPKGTIDNLHRGGYLVYLSILPLVSPDSELFLELRDKEFLINEANTTRPILVGWEGGYSAMYDLNNPKAKAYFASKLEQIKSKYGVDGFVFMPKSLGQVKSYKGSDYAVNYSKEWVNLASKYSSSIVDGGVNIQNLSVINKLGERKYSFENISSAISSVVTAGMLGYPYCSISTSDIKPHSEDDELLNVRLTQLQALMPIFNTPIDMYSYSKSNIEAINSALALNKKMSGYIKELITENSQTGAPIVRHIEYEFQGKSFYDCNDQFMLGSRYLVAPFLGKENKRMVRLPNGYWVDDLGVKYHGPRVIEITGNRNRIPYFENIKNSTTIKQMFK